MSTNTVLRRLVQPRLLILAMILRASSDYVTRKHCIKPPTIDAIVMKKKLLRHVLDAGKTQNAPPFLPNGICRVRGNRGTPQGAVRSEAS
jgi:hypothetical protein